MKILGIDPGIGITGVGIIETQGSRLSVLDFGAITTPTNTPLHQRLVEIYDKLSQIIAHFKPDAVAIEELFFNKNVSTALAVGQARGVAVLCAAKANIPITSYTPTQIKVAVAGYGKADKYQVGQMVKSLLKLDDVPKPDDVSDALAIAICHCHSHKIKSYT
ncbi:MAG: crossover junction endodeoxyribonuclease RuvC [bacterium]|nr:crossover junction endodeoxyribonuclease RuvC [bacterium]